MAYTPPICNVLDFDSSGSYTPPICTSITFDVGGDVAPDINTANVEIVLEAQESWVHNGPTINTANADINIEFFDYLLEPMYHHEPHDVEINIELPLHDIEILPDMVIDDVEINIELPLHDIEILPDMVIDDVTILTSATESLIRGTEEHHLPSTLIPEEGCGTGWGGNVGVDTLKRFPAGDGEDRRRVIAASFKAEDKPDLSIGFSWFILEYLDNTVHSSASVFKDLWDLSIAALWDQFSIIDEHNTALWGSNLEYINEHFAVPWNAPDPNDISKCAKFDEPVAYDWHFDTIWNAPDANDANKCIAWGPFSYYKICFGDIYWPPKACYSIPFNFPSKYPLTPDVCSGLTFDLTTYTSDPNPRCPFIGHWHTGWRDAGSGILIEPEDRLFPIAQQVYYMLNSILVKEYITNTPIEVLAVSATIDRDSWLWQFSVTVASRDCLEKMKPYNGVFVVIVIEINGYKWNCVVEGWSENRSFGKDAWTVVGRSHSLMFGDPIDMKHSGVETTPYAGGQIFNALIENKTPASGWHSDFESWIASWGESAGDIGRDYGTGYQDIESGFNAHDQMWFIPADTFSYTDKTTIEIMKTLTDTIGAYIQTDASENTFHVKPMYRNAPWKWDGSEDHYFGIVEDQCVEIARSYELKPYYNEVHVIGENVRSNGTLVEGDDAEDDSIFTKVWRNSDYTGQAPMITDKLLTTSESAGERGKMIIGEVGEWIKHTLRLSVLCPAGSGMGLFKPGDMLAVKERGEVWYGQVTSVSVAAARSTGGFSAQQVLNVEQHIDYVA